jgi:uncharacterized hydrophobic protein (TIGR00271 family)
MGDPRLRHRDPLTSRVIHIRAVSPTDITPGLVASLSSRPGVLNLIVLGGVARNPDGDAVEFDVSWFVLLTIAGLIAAVGIFTNSQILIVGAMVVGPEYSAIISVALGIDTKDRERIRAGAAALSFGFLLAIVVTLVFSVVVRTLGLEPEAFRLGLRPVSNLIDTPNVFSIVVATLAGIVGVVSLVEARTGALIGVFISVTTIPAAADIGVSTAFQDWREAGRSLVQLLLNVTILMTVGAVGLVVQQRVWRRVGRPVQG